MSSRLRSNFVRALRMHLGMSKSELARKADLSDRTVIRVEHGERTTESTAQSIISTFQLLVGQSKLELEDVFEPIPDSDYYRVREAPTARKERELLLEELLQPPP